MTREELLDRIQKYEWSDIEFKQAQHGVSQDAYRTVSAFANTSGGWLVFGVRETGGALDVVGVVEVDKVQNDFLTALRSGQRLNRVITVAEEATEMDGKTLLVFHIPESPRYEKPVYLGGDIRQSFIRRGAGDERCTATEIERFLRDAAADYDKQLMDLDAERFFDPDSLRWYRRVFDDRNPGKRQTLTDMEFLHEWSFVVERGASLAPTRAAVLVLGRPRYVRQVLRRPVVDCQFIDSNFEAWSPDLRWSDRIVVEENLLQAWLMLSERYVQRAERPFRIDAATLRRDDDPPDYVSFRESAINLLLHQDYGDQHRNACIRLFRDRTVFWNPGDAFAATDELLEPSASAREVRNPDIVAAFRRLGLSEQAGTGIRAIFRNWQELGHVPPVIDNDKKKQAFEVCLSKEALLTEEQRLFQSRLGLRLTDAEARVFAQACRKGRVTLVDAKAITGLMGTEAAAILAALHVQRVLRPLREGLYALAEHIEGRTDLPRLGQSESDQVSDRHGDLATDQVDMSTAHVTHRPTDMSTAHGHEQAKMSTDHAASPVDSDQERDTHDDSATDQVNMSTAHVTHRPSPMPTEHRGHVHPAKAHTVLSTTQREIVAYCDVPRLLTEIMNYLGVANRGHFKKTHLDPLIHDGLIVMTIPAKPRAPGQRYILTEAGLKLRAMHLETRQEEEQHGQG